MIFRDPAWLALLPVAFLAGWVWPRLGLRRPFRAAMVVLSVLLLMRPQWRTMDGGLDLWVLVDRSASMGASADRSVPEWRQILERARPGRDHELHWVDYAAEAVPQATNAGGPYTGSRSLTRTGQAVDHVLALRNPDRAARVLIFTDGYSTEPLAGTAEKLARAQVPMDFRLAGETGGADFRVRRLVLPQRALVSEPFLVEAEVTGPQDGPVPLSVYRNGRKLTDTEVMLKDGRGTARFTDRIGIGGSCRYEARILPVNDAHEGNNRYEAWIEIAGGPRILLVSRYTGDPLEPALKGQGFEVETVSDPARLQAGQLSGCRAVVLNNVPAWEVPADFLASLNFFVSAQGGGLLMAGGKKSFGAGGYFRSAIDELLPVSMELKKDQKKLAAAMMIVMDRSGSMAAPAGGGTKMDLANEGAARSIELLGYQDMVGVLAVDSEAHEVVPLQPVGSDSGRDEMREKVRRVRSEGGGIFVYNGLRAAWDQLRATAYGTRHIILFADAADAEEPGDYVKLLAEATAEGGTVSVIALGLETDADAAFLKDVAKRGNGRIFFTDRAEDLPNVFTAETVAVARSAFVSDPVPARPGGLWPEVAAGKPLDWLAEVDGYNLSYRRDWASQGLVSGDEFEAPLVAWGQRGSGRTAAVSFPLGGEFSERVRAWPKYGDFVQTLSRWLMGQPLPPGLGLRWEMEGTALALDLLYEGALWNEQFAREAPRIVLAAGARAETGLELTWQRMAPGHYRAVMDLDEGSVVRGAIQTGAHVIPFGPLSVGTQAEWAFDSARREELRQTAAASGGRELLDLAAAWQSPPVAQLADLRPWLLPLLLLLLLADALATRLGWNFPAVDWKRIFSPGRAGARPARVPADLLLEGAGAGAPAPPPTPGRNPAGAPPAIPAAVPAAGAAPGAPAARPAVPPAPAQSQVPVSLEAEEARRRARFARAKRGS